MQDASEQNLNPQKRSVPWFDNHVFISNYFLAEFLAETYDEWRPLRDDLSLRLKGGRIDGGIAKTESV